MEVAYSLKAVKKIVQHVGSYYRNSFSLASFLLLCCFLAACIAINYRVSFETRYVATPYGAFQAFGKYVLFYLLPFAFAFGLEAMFKKERSYLRDPAFWCLLIAAPMLFALRELSIVSLLGLDPLNYWVRMLGIVLGWCLAAVPIYVYWRSTKDEGEAFYGLTATGVSLKPYWVMLALMVPLLAIASFRGDFLETYPRAESLVGVPLDNRGIPYYLFYELIYGLDFVFIEFFFRGFIVLALGRIVGPAVILPMAALYVFIHFEKPVGEAISSLFGGMLLGAISYGSRSILGGIIVHVGIAWLMELFAYGQKSLR